MMLTFVRVRLSTRRKARAEKLKEIQRVKKLRLEREKKQKAERLEQARIAEMMRLERERKAEEEELRRRRLAEREERARVEREQKQKAERLEQARIAEMMRLERERKEEEEARKEELRRRRLAEREERARAEKDRIARALANQRKAAQESEKVEFLRRRAEEDRRREIELRRERVEAHKKQQAEARRKKAIQRTEQTRRTLSIRCNLNTLRPSLEVAPKSARKTRPATSSFEGHEIDRFEQRRGVVTIKSNGRMSGSTRIAPQAKFVLRLDVAINSEVVVQFMSSSARIGFQIISNGVEIGEGLQICSGGLGQVSGEMVRAPPGTLRIRWDNAYRDLSSRAPLSPATVKYSVEWKQIGSDVKFVAREESSLGVNAGFSGQIGSGVDQRRALSDLHAGDRNDQGLYEEEDDCIIS
eukprot:g3494.t1